MKTTIKLKRWLDSLSSPNTRRNYSLALREFCEDYTVTPDQTLKWSVVETEDNLRDHITKLKKSLAGSTVHIRLTALKMWFEFNRVDMSRTVTRQLSKGLKNGRVHLTYIPTRDEVRQVLNAVGLKHKVMISLSAFAGLRPVDIASLQYKHIKQSFENGDEVLTIQMRQQKTGQWYASFLGHQGTKYLRDYLKGRKMKNTDFIILNSRKLPFKSKGIRRAIETGIRKSVGKNPKGPQKRFVSYSFRKYFARAVQDLGYEKSEYLMGHSKGLTGLAAIYGGLADMDDQAIEKLKGSVILILPKIETQVSEAVLLRQNKDHETEVMKLRMEIGTIKETITQELLETMTKNIDTGLFNMFFKAPPELAHKTLDEARGMLEAEAKHHQLTTGEVWDSIAKEPVEGGEDKERMLVRKPE